MVRSGLLFPLLKRHDLPPGSLFFGQQHLYSYRFFGKRWHTVPLIETPHYSLLEGDKDRYLGYLKVSWEYYPLENSEDSRQRQADKVLTLKSDIERSGVKKPITYYERFDGKRIIIDGNHRAAVSAHLGLPVPAVKWSVKKYLENNLSNPSYFYGSGNKGLPYTSIYHGSKEIVKGRRRDIYERYKLVHHEDIAGKKILDLGCNTGGAMFLVADDAKSVMGVDVHPKVLTSAIRTNVLFAAPCEFELRDLSTPLDLDEKFSTAFCFSIDKHVDNNKVLASNIASNVTETLYFETHPKSKMPEEIKDICKNIEFKGKTGPEKDRGLYRCTLKTME